MGRESPNTRPRVPRPPDIRGAHSFEMWASSGIKQRLGGAGVLSGYTIIKRATGKSHVDHEYEFNSKEELAGVLKQFFANVMVLETSSVDQFEERGKRYFYASNGDVPFDPAWGPHLRL
jgi:hypothetical protein